MAVFAKWEIIASSVASSSVAGLAPAESWSDLARDRFGDDKDAVDFHAHASNALALGALPAPMSGM